MVEYACPVWSTNLPKYWSDSIETVQKRALKSIYPGCTYEEILKTVKLPTLSTRRDDLCKKYFNGMKQNKHKLNHLLPETRDVPYLLRFSMFLYILLVSYSRVSNDVNLNVFWKFYPVFNVIIIVFLLSI